MANDLPSSLAPASATRRRWLGAAGASAGALLAAGRAPAQAVSVTGVALPLTAATTEGPYYLASPPVRADITEGLKGVPLEVRFSVVDAGGKPLPGLQVDVWHCDAVGLYSGFGGQGDQRTTSAVGKTFLRGRQPTALDGVAAFRSVYPGWYEGRTTHIHCKVWNGARQVLTTQFFLPDALSEFLYTQLPAYRRARVRDVLNSNDGIALEAGDTVVGAVRQFADRYVASLTLVVDAAAGSAGEASGPSGGRRSPPGDGADRRRGPSTGGGPGGRAVLEGEARLAALLPGVPRR